ncbi:unnamed protein product, partial [Ixodes pacificus]
MNLSRGTAVCMGKHKQTAMASAALEALLTSPAWRAARTLVPRPPRVVDVFLRSEFVGPPLGTVFKRKTLARWHKPPSDLEGSAVYAFIPLSFCFILHSSSFESPCDKSDAPENTTHVQGSSRRQRRPWKRRGAGQGK